MKLLKINIYRVKLDGRGDRELMITKMKPRKLVELGNRSVKSTWAAEDFPQQPDLYPERERASSLVPSTLCLSLSGRTKPPFKVPCPLLNLMFLQLTFRVVKLLPSDACIKSDRRAKAGNTTLN